MKRYYEIGETFNAHDGTMLKVVEADRATCNGCYYFSYLCAMRNIPSKDRLNCMSHRRRDKTAVIFQKVESCKN